MRATCALPRVCWTWGIREPAALPIGSAQQSTPAQYPQDLVPPSISRWCGRHALGLVKTTALSLGLVSESGDSGVETRW